MRCKGYLVRVEVKIAANNISLTKPDPIVAELVILRNLEVGTSVRIPFLLKAVYLSCAAITIRKLHFSKLEVSFSDRPSR